MLLNHVFVSIIELNVIQSRYSLRISVYLKKMQRHTHSVAVMMNSFWINIIADPFSKPRERDRERERQNSKKASNNILVYHDYFGAWAPYVVTDMAAFGVKILQHKTSLGIRPNWFKSIHCNQCIPKIVNNVARTRYAHIHSRLVA